MNLLQQLEDRGAMEGISLLRTQCSRLGAFIILLIFTGLSGDLRAYPNGKVGHTAPGGNGCASCHGAKSANVAISIRGAADTIKVAPGAATKLVAVVAHATLPKAGINVAVKTDLTGTTAAGTMTAGTGTKLLSGEITHSSARAMSGGEAGFEFTWTAPKTAGTYYLRAVGLAVNGNGGNDSKDIWNVLAGIPIVVTAAPPPPPPPPPAAKPALTLTSPKGGEKFLFGASTTISWTAKDIKNVKIEWSATGSGGPWTTISAAEQASKGSLSWQIPSEATSQGFIRISNADSAALNSMNSVAFSIADKPKTLSLLFPAGGERFLVGSVQTVRWSAGNTQAVNIEYSSAGASGPWTVLAGNYPAGAGSYSWTLPGEATAQGYIRIVSSADAGLFSINTLPFTISLPQKPSAITLVKPEGGEIFMAGGKTIIQWIAEKKLVERNRPRKLSFSQRNTLLGDDDDDDSDDDDDDSDDDDDDSDDDDDDSDDDDDDSDDDDDDSDDDDDDSDDDDDDSDDDDDDSDDDDDDSDDDDDDSTDTGGDDNDSTGTGGQDTTGTGGQDSTGTGGQDSTDTGGQDSTGTGGQDTTGTGGQDSSAQVQSVILEWSANGEQGPWMLIKDSLSLSSTGYEWNIPDTITSTGYIRIRDRKDSTIYSMNSIPFEIVREKKILLTGDVQADTLQTGSSVEISWQSTGLRNLRITLERNGSQVAEITKSILASIGRLSWNVPAEPDSMLSIRISSIEDANISCTTRLFSIAAPKPVKDTTSGGDPTDTTDSNPPDNGGDPGDTGNDGGDGGDTDDGDTDGSEQAPAEPAAENPARGFRIVSTGGNPALGDRGWKLGMEITEAMPMTIQLVNSSGEIVWTRNITPDTGTQEIFIPSSQLSADIYILHVRTIGRPVIQKLLLQR